MTATPDAYDAFWRHVMRRSYHQLPQGADLTPLEIEGLEPERIVAHWDTQEDTWHAGVSRLREDGAAVITPLTIERVDAYARAYWADGTSSPWSMPPKEGA